MFVMITIYIYTHDNHHEHQYHDDPCDWSIGPRKYYDSAIAPREMYDQESVGERSGRFTGMSLAAPPKNGGLMGFNYEKWWFNGM